MSPGTKKRDCKVSFSLLRGMALFSIVGMVSTSVTLASDPAPKCAAPAPLEGHFDERAPLYIVSLKASRENFSRRVEKLARAFAFRTVSQWPDIKAFAAALTPLEVAALRCNVDVKSIEFEAVATAS